MSRTYLRILMRLIVPVSMSALVACGERDEVKHNPQVNPEAGAALLSIYYHGYPEELRPGSEEMGEYQFMPVDRAALILAGESGEAADYRRRQAIVKLSVANYHDGLIRDDSIRGALVTLGAPLQAIEHALADAESGTWSSMEPIVYQVLAVAGLGSDCATASTDVGFDPWTGATLVTFSVKELHRDFDELAVVLDPQNWAQCSTYFQKSFVALEVAGDYPLDPEGNAQPDPYPPAPGSTWNDVLFEYFDFSYGVYVGWFKNLLSIDAVRTDDQFFFQYELHQSIRAKFGWLGEFNQPLVRDGGFMSLEKMDDGTLETRGLKIFQYRWALSGLNWLVPIMLSSMGDEAKTISCTCQVPETESESIWVTFWNWFKSWWL